MMIDTWTIFGDHKITMLVFKTSLPLGDFGQIVPYFYVFEIHPYYTEILQLFLCAYVVYNPCLDHRNMEKNNLYSLSFEYL